MIDGLGVVVDGPGGFGRAAADDLGEELKISCVRQRLLAYAGKSPLIKGISFLRGI
jgi:hypothetical protein